MGIPLPILIQICDCLGLDLLVHANGRVAGVAQQCTYDARLMAVIDCKLPTGLWYFEAYGASAILRRKHRGVLLPSDAELIAQDPFPVRLRLRRPVDDATLSASRPPTAAS